jgi:hypothetical protein
LKQPTNVPPPPRPQLIDAPLPPARVASVNGGGTNLFCPVCGHEFLPDELSKKPHCRHCGYLES